MSYERGTFLSLSTPEQLLALGGFPNSTSGADDPIIASHPQNSDRKCMFCRITHDGSTDPHASYVDRYVVGSGDDVTMRFGFHYTHGGADNIGAFTLLEMYDELDQLVARCVVVVGDIRFLAFNTSGTQSGNSAIGVIRPGKDIDHTVTVRYRSDVANSNLQIIINDEEAVLASHQEDRSIAYIRLGGRTQFGASNLSGNKDFYFFDVKFCEDEEDADLPLMGLALGPCVDAGAGLCTQSVRFWADSGRLGLAGEDTYTVQFQRREQGAGEWSDAGSPVAIDPDATDERIITTTIDGAENTVYEYRALLLDDEAETIYTSNVAIGRTPSTPGGTPTTLEYWVGSCTSQRNINVPYVSFPYCTGITHAPHGLVNAGDNAYLVDVPGWPNETDDAGLRGGIRANFLWERNMREAMAAAPYFAVRDDQDSAVSGAHGASMTGDDAEVFAEAVKAGVPWWSGQRPIARRIAGGEGLYWDTARTRHILVDMRSAKDRTPGNETMLGAAQIAAVKGLLENCPPIVIFHSPGTILRGHSDPNLPDGSGVDGWNELIEGDRPYLTELYDLFDHFYANSPQSMLVPICYAYHAQCVGVDPDWLDGRWGDRVKPVWTCGPWGVVGRGWLIFNDDIENGGSTLLFSDGDPNNPSYRPTRVTIDESARTVTLTHHNAATEQTLYSDTYTAPASSGGGDTNQSAAAYPAASSAAFPAAWRQ